MKRTKLLLFILMFSAASSAHAACQFVDSSSHKLAGYAGAAITMGAGSTYYGNVHVNAAATLGVSASVGGHVVAGDGVTLGGVANVDGSIVAGGAVTVGAGATTGPITANNSSAIASHLDELTAEQTRLRGLAVPAANELAATMNGTATTLEAGVYHAAGMVTAASTTLTFDGKGVKGDWIFNIDSYISFGASMNMVLLDVTDDSTITWNAGGYTTVGANSDIIGTYITEVYAVTGSDVTLKGVGGVCGRIFSTTAYVTIGANNVIGEDGCTDGGFSPGVTAEVGSNPPDHFVIGHDNEGFFCLAETVPVTATYSDNSITTCYQGTITLNTQTGTGDWSLFSGTGSLVDATANDGLATYTYSLEDNGTAEFSLSYSAGDATMDIDTYAGAIRDNDVEGNMVFSPTGFAITASELITLPSNDPILTQTAGTSYNAHITAFSSCAITNSYTGNKNITLSTGFDNPSTGTVNILSGASATPTLTFVDGKAVLPIKYKDAGRVSVSVTDGALSGSSNNFVVKPASFAIVPANAPFTAIGPTDAIYTSAGINFNITLTATDSEGDTTLNYGNENYDNEFPAETIALTHLLALPTPASGGVSGIFTTNLSKTGSGIYSGTANWSEVGIIDLIAIVGDGDYLGSGEDVSTTLSNVGRFTPASFSITAPVNGSWQNEQISGSGGFTYIGQPFSYATVPAFTLNALSAAGDITVNYSGVWSKLTDLGIVFNEPTSDRVKLDSTAVAGAFMPLVYDKHLTSLDIPTGNGTFNFEFAAADSFVYTRDANSQVTPFAPTIDLVIASITDSDSITTGPVNTTLTPVAPNAASTDMRFGRLGMSNVLGSELTALVMPMQVEIFNASGSFAVHSDDSATQIDFSNLTLDDMLSTPTASTVTVANSTASAGVFDVNFSSPGAGVDGYIDVTPLLGAAGANLEWLQYDWSTGTNTFDENPTAKATFGIYKGNDVQIYIQQTYQ
jgi:hypothetical protein